MSFFTVFWAPNPRLSGTLSLPCSIAFRTKPPVSGRIADACIPLLKKWFVQTRTIAKTLFNTGLNRNLQSLNALKPYMLAGVFSLDITQCMI